MEIGAGRSATHRSSTERPTTLAFPLVPLALLAAPLVEIAVFVMVGSRIGVLPTVGLTVATSILGAVLLRLQGLGIMTRISRTMEAGGSPGRDLVHGLMVMLAGLLLLLPGFVTDAIGLLLFVPPVRDLAWRLVKDRIVVASAATGFRPRGAGRTIDLDADDFAREREAERERPLIDGDR